MDEIENKYVCLQIQKKTHTFSPSYQSYNQKLGAIIDTLSLSFLGILPLLRLALIQIYVLHGGKK